MLTFKNAPNFEDKQDAGNDNVYNVTVTVTDNGIDGARGASNHLSISKSLAVTVTDVNETPTITSGPSTATFDENATGVIATYVATDPDATTGTMSWDLSGQRRWRLQHHLERERNGHSSRSRVRRTTRGRTTPAATTSTT